MIYFLTTLKASKNHSLAISESLETCLLLQIAMYRILTLEHLRIYSAFYRVGTIYLVITVFTFHFLLHTWCEFVVCCNCKIVIWQSDLGWHVHQYWVCPVAVVIPSGIFFVINWNNENWLRTKHWNILQTFRYRKREICILCFFCKLFWTCLILAGSILMCFFSLVVLFFSSWAITTGSLCCQLFSCSQSSKVKYAFKTWV